MDMQVKYTVTHCEVHNIFTGKVYKYAGINCEICNIWTGGIYK